MKSETFLAMEAERLKGLVIELVKQKKMEEAVKASIQLETIEWVLK